MTKLFVCVFAFLVMQQLLSSVVDAKMHHGFPMASCCDVERTPAMVEHSEKVKKLWGECDQEIGESSSSEEGKHKGRFPCMTECMAQKQNLLNEDKTMNETAFKDYIVKEVATQDHLKQIAEETAKKCLEKAKQPEDEDYPSKCSKETMKVMKCTVKTFMEACPTDLQIKTEPCMKMREMIQKRKP